MRYNIINKARHLIFISAIILLGSILITACSTSPEFDLVPSIKYESIEIKRKSETSIGQTLNEDIISLTISFEDGDGDLGFRNNEYNPPYHFSDLILDEEGEIISFGSSPDLPPFSFYDYRIISDSNFNIRDTALIDFNERFFNIYVSFFVNRPESEGFEEFDWGKESPFYQPFHGRFPIFRPRSYDRPAEGSLTYDMNSLGFRYIFKNYPVYLEVYILDRAGNKSNIVKTDIFQFSPLD